MTNSKKPRLNSMLKNLRYLTIAFSIMFPLVFTSHVALAAEASDTERDRCLLDAIASASPDTTLAQLRQRCEELSSERVSPSTALASTIAAERQSLSRDFNLTPHRPNYIMPFTHNATPNQLEDFFDLGEESVDHSEAEFQISIKFPIVRGIFNENTDLLVAYTSHSWWQVYNDASSNSGDTNYEPEIFLRHYGGPKILGAQVGFWDLGFVHESNGRSELFSTISRSWNRLYGTVGFEFGDLTLALKAWYRIPEDEDDDENPDLHQYRGYGNIRAVWAPNKNTFTAMYRPGTEEDGYELTWSYPISNNMRFFAKYYNGYGESLLDYNHEVERIGIGFTINDFITN